MNKENKDFEIEIPFVLGNSNYDIDLHTSYLAFILCISPAIAILILGAIKLI